MKNSKRRGIRQKFTRLITIISIVSLIVTTCCSFYSMLKIRTSSLETAAGDAKERLAELTENRASIADSMLLLAQNQTIMVASGAADKIKNADTYLLGYNEQNLPDLTCNEKYTLGTYSVHVRVPENLLKNVQKDDTDTVIKAEIDREASTGGKFSVNEELYLASLLSNEFAQIERFRNEDGTYTGFAASYFCFNDSGMDILGDPLTAAMISYDGRTRGWYTGAVEAYQNNTLTKSGVYWTEPVQDGSGRGISMICAVPVVVDDQIVGVAGSGGLLTNFADLVESSGIGSTGYSFMVSRNNTKVIINPNTSEKESKQSEVMIETDLSQSENKGLAELAYHIKHNDKSEISTINIDGQDCYVTYSALSNNDWTLVTVIGTNDDLIMTSYHKVDDQIRNAIMIFVALVVVIILSVILISRRFATSFTTPIIELKNGVDEIGGGKLDHVLHIETGDEIEDLGNSFNEMTENLNNYISNLAAVTAEKERIGAELNVATHIQASMLPCIFPAFPNRGEFDVFATMNPAKEVGGDFYDFFMVDDTHIAIVMADVSGKGVPAALFMVIAKTLIKDHTYPGASLGEVFTDVNRLLCESNSGELFVTGFEGVLDLVTGEFRYVNAGHEMPFICKKGEKYSPYKIKPGFVLAGMEGMRYKEFSIMLEPGDKIFQYTDGVTEATDKDGNLYGMERLENILSANSEADPFELLPAVKTDIDAFVGEAPQFDDITMLCLEYKKRAKASEQ